jgi:hypothetical protein
MCAVRACVRHLPESRTSGDVASHMYQLADESVVPVSHRRRSSRKKLALVIAKVCVRV